MTVPKLRFEGITGDWEERKLSEVSSYSNGCSYENDVKPFGKYQLVTLKSVDMKGNLVDSGKYIDKEVPTLIKDTLVMILSEQAPGLLGMTALIPENNKYVLNQRVAEIRPKNNIDSYFLSIAINRCQQYFSKRGAGTKVQNISKGNVENFIFYCPKVEEQKKIGCFFKHLDKIIQLQQEKIDLLKEQKKGFLQKMFPKAGETQPEMRFEGFTGDWVERELKDIVKWSKGSNLPKSVLNESKKGEEVIHYADLYKFPPVVSYVIHWSDSGQGTVIPDNSLLFPMSDVTPIGLARTSTITKSGVKAGSDTLIGMIDEKHNSQFISYQINANSQKIIPLVTGTTVRHISAKALDTLDIMITSQEEQVKISTFFKQLDDTIALHQQKLDLYKEQKKGFMQQLFI